MNNEYLDGRFVKDSKTLENEIKNIELREQDVQNIISTIEQNINDIDHLILQEKRKKTPDGNKIKNLRAAILSNTQTLNEYYNTYRGYEEVKFKYRKLITDKGLDYEKLKADLNKLDNRSKFDNRQLLDVLDVIAEKIRESKKLTTNGNGTVKAEPNIMEETTCELSCHDEYSL